MELIDAVEVSEPSKLPSELQELTKCDACTALCCQYITQQIDTPTTKAEFDILLWQISHRGVHVFKDSNGWYLLIQTPCKHLQEDYRCAIYLKRPAICREHSTDHCERDVPIDEGCDYYFQDYVALDDYCRKRFKRWDKRFEVKAKKKKTKKNNRSKD